MNQIASFVQAMFSELPKTELVVKTRLQITENMEEKYDALIREGKNENEALGIVISEFGSIDEIRNALGIEEQNQSNMLMTIDANDDRLLSLMDEYRSYNPKCNLAVAAAIMIFIFSVVLMDIWDNTMVFFTMIAFGVGLLIYFLGRKQDYKRLMAERRAELGLPILDSNGFCLNTMNRRWNAIYTAIPIIALLIFLFLGFFFNRWHPGWVVFILIPLAYCIINIVRRD